MFKITFSHYYSATNGINYLKSVCIFFLFLPNVPSVLGKFGVGQFFFGLLMGIFRFYCVTSEYMYMYKYYRQNKNKQIYIMYTFAFVTNMSRHGACASKRNSELLFVYEVNILIARKCLIGIRMCSARRYNRSYAYIYRSRHRRRLLGTFDQPTGPGP